MNKLLCLLLVTLLVSCSAAKPKVPTKKTGKTAQREIYRPKTTTPTKPVVVNERPVEPKMETLEATSKIKVTTAMVLAYISQYKDIAKTNMANHGIPASIILAQGILESGAGTGALCNLANNHFGIKCHKEWTGPSVKYDDDSLQECFRKYDHAEQSYEDHAAFLTSRAWYAPLFQLPKDDYKAWAKGLRKAGYATDVKYPEKLIALIERYQLQQYDAEVLGKSYVFVTKKEDREMVPNESKYMVLQGDTLYSISKKLNVRVEDLKAKNNLTDNAISIGQTLIIR